MSEPDKRMTIRLGVDGKEIAAAAIKGAEDARQSGTAEDRERYVTERAQFIARAHHGAMGAAMRKVSGQPVVVAPWSQMPIETQLVCIAAARDLIDKGVLR